MKTVKKILRSIRGLSSPIGGVSWKLEGIEDKVVDINYPSDSGMKEELNIVGYRIAWCAEKNLSRKIDLESWEKVVWEDQTGKQFLLKCSDGLTLIRKKKESA